MVVSFALIGGGPVLLDEPTTAQPPAAIGEILDGVGILLLATVLVLGIMDLAPIPASAVSREWPRKEA